MGKVLPMNMEAKAAKRINNNSSVELYRDDYKTP